MGSSMSEIQINCINEKWHPHGRYYGITHLGAGGRNRWTLEEAIQLIKSRTYRFYTWADGKRADVRVVNGPYGEYVRTVADGVETDNLLKLNACPL